MNLTLTPDFMFARTADITPAFLKNNSIAALLCDIDNTLSPYEDAEPNDEICAWVKSMQAAGIDTYVELGPGKVLSGLVKKTLKGVTILNVENQKSLEKTLEALKG